MTADRPPAVVPPPLSAFAPLSAFVAVLPRLAAACVLAASVAACQTNPATGSKDFTPFMSRADEARLGAEAHPGVLDENGGVYRDPRVSGYVAQVGGRLAANTETPDAAFTFTVLNTPIVNAFALPGGYVYVTRGILALFNDEAELASVLGHEIGHVTARHTAKRYNQQMMTGILGAGIGLATGSSALGNLVNQGSQLYLLSYSRDQEYQSDSLGIRYMTRTGYDPYGSPDMLRALLASDRLSAVLSRNEGKQRPPEFYSTHPNTEKRVAEAEEIAAGTGVARAVKPRFRDRYLDAIDGMLYGDDPAQGIVRGQTFSHPGLKFAFTAPPGYLLQNTAEAVMMKGPGGDAALLMASPTAAGTTTAASMQKTWQTVVKETPLEGIQTLTINGMEAVTGEATGRTQSGETLVRILTIRYDATHAYSFIMLTPARLIEQTRDGLQRMTFSFRKLTDAEAAAIKPLIIRVVTVRAGDTQTSLARRMAFSDYQLDRFRTINGLGEGDVLTPGQRVKIIVEKP